MASMVLLKGFGGSAALIAAECMFLKKAVPQMYDASAYGLPKAYAAVLLVNVVVSTFVLMGLGMKVGLARKKYDVPLPQMYATGTDKSAVTFNCIQRGHQQALETYTQFIAMSLLGGVSSPLTVAFGGVAYAIGRNQWAAGYATGDPDKRYEGMWTRFVWYSLLLVMAATVYTALQICCPFFA